MGTLHFGVVAAFLGYFKHLLPLGRIEEKSRLRVQSLREFGMTNKCREILSELCETC